MCGNVIRPNLAFTFAGLLICRHCVFADRVNASHLYAQYERPEAIDCHIFRRGITGYAPRSPTNLPLKQYLDTLATPINPDSGESLTGPGNVLKW